MQNFPGFLRGLAVFLGVAVPAALVNSGLRLFQKQIQLAFMLRLSRHLHQLYCSNRSYYSASVLGGARPGCLWPSCIAVHGCTWASVPWGCPGSCVRACTTPAL